MARIKTLTKSQATKLFAVNAERTRIKHNISQEKFAESIDMSLSMYKRLISEQRQVDAAYALMRLCAQYDVHIFELFDLDDDVYKMISDIESLDADQVEFIKLVIKHELDIKKERNH